MKSLRRDEALQVLLGDEVSVATFFSEYWDKKPLVVQGSKGRIPEYMDLTAAEFLRHVEHPDVSRSHDPDKFPVLILPVVPGKMTPEEKEQWLPHCANRRHSAEAAQLGTQLLAHGGSLQVMNVHHLIKKYEILRACLQRDFRCFGGSIELHMMLSMEGEVINPHSDPRSGMTLQLQGEKSWRISKSPVARSGSYEPIQLNDVEFEGQPIEWMDVTLTPGDFMYFPQGTVHATLGGRGHSLGLLISQAGPTYGDIMAELVRKQLQHSSWLSRPVFNPGWETDGIFNAKAALEEMLAPRLEELKKHIEYLVTPEGNSELEEFMVHTGSSTPDRAKSVADFRAMTHRQQTLSQLGALAEPQVEKDTILQWREPANTICTIEEDEGEEALFLSHNETQLVFDEPRFWILAKTLAAQAGRFSAEDIYRDCEDSLTWDEVRERLESLLSEFILLSPTHPYAGWS